MKRNIFCIKQFVKRVAKTRHLTLHAVANVAPTRNLVDMLCGKTVGMSNWSFIFKRHFAADSTTISTVNSRKVTVSSSMLLKSQKMVVRF